MALDATALESALVATPEPATRLGRARLRSRLELWIPVGVLAVMVLACFVWPYVYKLPNPDAIGQPALAPFHAGHLLGTDDIGRDLLSRALYGGQVSIEVGLGSVAIGILVGGGLGVVGGYLGGKVDVFIARLLDVLLAFPALVLALAVASYLGPNERDEIFAIAFFTTPAFGRYTRGATIRLRESEFLSANRILGARSPYVILRHVLPNIAGALLTFALLNVAGAMLAEAGLSFLGAGIRPPAPSWGNMIAEGQQYYSSAPHIFIVPSCFLFVTILVLNLLGDAVRRRWRV